MDQDTGPERLVHVVRSERVGADASIVILADLVDPTWLVKIGMVGVIEEGTRGYLRFVPRREVRPNRRAWPDGWAFRPAADTVGACMHETGRSEAGTPTPNGLGPAGITGGA